MKERKKKERVIKKKQIKNGTRQKERKKRRID